jgi:hypothetical protein
LDTPTRNLESYFLGVVERARAKAETSGATSGNQVAKFIAGGEGASSAQSDRVLDRLTRPNAAPAVKVEVQEPVAAVDQARLESLTRPVEASPAAVPVVETPAVDLAKANEKLSGLLGKKP